MPQLQAHDPKAAAGNDASLLADFFAQLTDERHPRIDGSSIAIVVAHPDDETIGCGALLARLDRPHVIVVTDGAPRDLRDAKRYGFANAADYARTRHTELIACLAAAGIEADSLTELSIPDQEAATHLPEIAVKLAALLTEHGIRIVLTHVYEGGHPDHDAIAFAVHHACRLLRRRGEAMAIVEMPFYRAADSGDVKQSFRGEQGITLQLTEEEADLKTRMLSCHATQRDTLEGFRTDAEYFRAAPEYDFSELPNGGRLLYEAQDWNMSAGRWLALVRAAGAHLEEEAKRWR